MVENLQKWKTSQAETLAVNHKQPQGEAYNATEPRTYNDMRFSKAVSSLPTVVLTKINEYHSSGKFPEKICDKPTQNCVSADVSDTVFDEKNAIYRKDETQNTLVTLQNTIKLPIPKRIDVERLTSLNILDLNILDCKIVKPSENAIQPVSFEELLLKSIAKNDPTKTKKKNASSIATRKY